MPTLSITKNYTDGATLTEAHLDTAFEGVEAFLNTTKIDSDNIQDGGVVAAAIGTSAVTSAKIDSSAVTTAKVADSAITTAKIADSNVTTAKLADGAVTSAKVETALLLPTGMVSPYAGAAAPTGWLLCYGQTISRTTYAALFTAISTVYGVGDGSTTFTLPDMRGRVAAGQDDMGGTSSNRLIGTYTGLDGDTLGASGGAEHVALSISKMPSHYHSHGADLRRATTESIYYASGGLNATFDGGVGTDTSTSYQGGDEAHNNMQPTIILNYIIKT